MHKWRMKHPDHAKAAAKVSDSTYGSLTDDSEVSEAADDAYSSAMHSVAAESRARVIAKDAAAKARRAKGRRRG